VTRRPGRRWGGVSVRGLEAGLAVLEKGRSQAVNVRPPGRTEGVGEEEGRRKEEEVESASRLSNMGEGMTGWNACTGAAKRRQKVDAAAAVPKVMRLAERRVFRLQCWV